MAHELQSCAIDAQRRTRALTALCSQEDIVVRYGDARDFDGVVLEFLMRQPEVSSALVRGSTLTKQQFWGSHPELAGDDEL